MTEQEIKIEKLEKEIEILKKRVDYFYEEIRPFIRKLKLVDVTVHEGQCLNVEGTKELNEKGYVTVKFDFGKEGE